MINDENFVWEPNAVVFSKRGKSPGKYTYFAEIRVGMHNYVISGKEHLTREAAKEEADEKADLIKAAIQHTINFHTDKMKIAKE